MFLLFLSPHLTLIDPHDYYYFGSGLKLNAGDNEKQMWVLSLGTC